MNQPPREPAIADLVWRSNVYRLARVLLLIDSDSLADAVAVAFARHHQQAALLGRGYGFRVASFWQPTVAAGAKPLTEEEERSFARERVTPYHRPDDRGSDRKRPSGGRRGGAGALIREQRYRFAAGRGRVATLRPSLQGDRLAGSAANNCKI